MAVFYLKMTAGPSETVGIVNENKKSAPAVLSEPCHRGCFFFKFTMQTAVTKLQTAS